MNLLRNNLLLLLPFSCCLGAALCSSLDSSQPVSVFVDPFSPSAVVLDNFVCATLDWWPSNKCDYGTCSWGNASILNLDLSNPVLQNAVKALSPLRLRLGGTLQDDVVYQVGSNFEPCDPFVPGPTDAFGFPRGCLTMQRWDELNNFFRSTGCEVAFGLNALFGRRITNATSSGAWDPTNARDFIQYTHGKGYNITAWELGNELTGFDSVGTSISPRDYSVDMKQLSEIVKEVYADQAFPPLLVAPDSAGFDANWTAAFLQFSGEGTVDVVTHHIYNLGAGVDTDLVEKILNPLYLDGEIATFRAVNETLQQYGPWAKVWVGEAGGAYNSGQHLVTDAFVCGFWYLDQLGMSSSFGTQSYCRQSLIGGNYGLLNTTTFHPNPDYYGALLWHRLMGAKVLATNRVGADYLRAYAHCSKHKKGVAVLLLNLSNQTSYDVDVSMMPFQSVTAREEYHLTPQNGDLHSQTSLLNGVPLEVTAEGEIPDLLPLMKDTKSPVSMQPLSLAFIVFSVQITACADS